MNSIMKKTLLILGIALSQPVFACKFIQTSLESKINLHEVVFIGKVLKDANNMNGQTNEVGKIIVEKNIKGVKEKQIYLLNSHPSSCGLGFQKEQVWLIIGSIKDNTIFSSAPDGSYIINSKEDMQNTLIEINKVIKK